MNSHTYEIVDGEYALLLRSLTDMVVCAAALRIPHLKVDVWGPGWAGYDRHLSLSTNIRRRQCRLSELERWDEEAEERRDIAEMLRRANRTACVYSTHLQWAAEADTLQLENWRPTLLLSPVILHCWMRLQRGQTIWTVGVQIRASMWSGRYRQCDCGGRWMAWLIRAYRDIFKQSDPHVNALDCGSLLVQ